MSYRSPSPLRRRAALLAGSLASASIVVGMSAAPAHAVGGAVVGINGTTLIVASPTSEDNSIQVQAYKGDFYVSDSKADPVAGNGCSAGSTPDEVVCPIGTVTGIQMSPGLGNDIALNFTSYPATIDGGAGDDVVAGIAVGDVFIGGTGNDMVSYAYATTGVSVTIDGVANDGAPGENDQVGTDIEYVYGSPHDDILVGSANNDRLYGGAGDDIMDGLAGTDRIDGMDGTDTVNYAGRSVPLHVELGGTAASGAVGENDTVTTTTENAIGGTNDDVVIGNDSANVLRGGAGNDTLSGYDLDDTLIGGTGNDTFIGGSGTDCASYEDRSGPVTATLGTSSGNGTGAESDGFTSDVECLRGGTGADHLIGNAAANTLDGNSGDDLLDGGTGADTVIGGAGTDTIDYSTRTAPVVTYMNSGGPSGEAGEGDVLGNDLENTVGGSGNDELNGNDLGNHLEGRGGDDVLTGEGGADVLSGGDGTDTVDYGSRTAPLTIRLDQTATSGEAGEGDQIDLDVEAAVGGTGNDTLIGNAAANTLNGMAGNDLIDGGLGADGMVGGAGTDTVTYAARSSAVVASINGLADDGQTGEGDTIATDVENLLGGSGNDTLTGSAGTNALTGGAGSDRLNGGNGNDALSGGAGKDVLLGGSGNDALNGGSENDVLDGGAGADSMVGGTGIDTVTYASRTVSVKASIDGRRNDGATGEGDLIGSGVENITGGKTTDRISGSSVANLLIGGGGKDALFGMGGKDVLKGGIGRDSADGGAGTDTCVTEVKTRCER